MARVTFLPERRTVEIRRGEQLLAASWKVGVGIKSICGGRGKCGSCVVEIHGVESSADSLTPPSDAERNLLPAAGPEQTLRLACQCEVRADVAVSIPPESQAVKIAPRKPFTVTQVAARPATVRVAVELERAEAAPRPLAGRIADAVARSIGKRSLTLPFDVLADFSKTARFDAARPITATVYRERSIIQLRAGRHDAMCGVAIDVGTTSVVVFLCDLASGAVLAMGTAANPQAMFGEDVISRMSHIQRDVEALGEMRRLLVDELNRLIGEACTASGVDRDDVVDAVIVGNPTMQHILLGVNPEPLGRAPYQPVWSDGVEAEAEAVGLAIAPRARAFVFPMVSGYIGGDTLAAVLTRGPEFYRGTHLLVDIGTNGEVVLAHHGRLYATSCATGPVYEGAHIQCGMRAAPGAIERVWTEPDGDIRWAVIREDGARGTTRPVGLCGSGVISAVAALLDAELIGVDGALADADAHPGLRVKSDSPMREVVLVPKSRSHTGRDIVLTQQDVRSVQLGKSALRSGIEILLAEHGVSHLDRVYLAGTFGNHLQPEDLLKLGLLPPLPVERIRSIGNAAGDGARMALFNRYHRRRAVALAQRLHVLDLSGRGDFQDLFIAHTDLAPMPASGDVGSAA